LSSTGPCDGTAAQERDRPFGTAARERDRPFGTAARERDRPFGTAARERDRPFGTAAREGDRPFGTAANQRGLRTMGRLRPCPILCLIRVNGTPRKELGTFSGEPSGTANGNEGPRPGGAVPSGVSDVPSRRRLDCTIGHACVEGECRWALRGCPGVRVGSTGHGQGTSERTRVRSWARAVSPTVGTAGEFVMRASKRMNYRGTVQQRRIPGRTAVQPESPVALWERVIGQQRNRSRALDHAELLSIRVPPP